MIGGFCRTFSALLHTAQRSRGGVRASLALALAIMAATLALARPCPGDHAQTLALARPCLGYHVQTLALARHCPGYHVQPLALRLPDFAMGAIVFVLRRSVGIFFDDAVIVATVF